MSIQQPTIKHMNNLGLANALVLKYRNKITVLRQIRIEQRAKATNYNESSHYREDFKYRALMTMKKIELLNGVIADIKRLTS